MNERADLWSESKSGTSSTSLYVSSPSVGIEGAPRCEMFLIDVEGVPNGTEEWREQGDTQWMNFFFETEAEKEIMTGDKFNLERRMRLFKSFAEQKLGKWSKIGKSIWINKQTLLKLLGIELSSKEICVLWNSCSMEFYGLYSAIPRGP